MADHDRVAGAEEDVDLAELDLLLGVVVARGPQDDEVGLVVVLELRALVGVARVLERQLVQAEDLPDALELLAGRLVQAEPDELVAALAERGGVLEVERALVLAGAVAVVSAVDDHRVSTTKCGVRC